MAGEFRTWLKIYQEMQLQYKEVLRRCITSCIGICLIRWNPYISANEAGDISCVRIERLYIAQLKDDFAASYES